MLFRTTPARGLPFPVITERRTIDAARDNTSTSRSPHQIMDILSPDERSRRMARIRGRDTRPELIVRRLLSGLGFRYRLHEKKLPGTPDIVFPSLKKVIFVHGCFWHRHTCRQGQSVPSTRPRFWRVKFEQNVSRDRRVRRRLRVEGWRSLAVWECATKGNLDNLASKLIAFLEN
jgi:DNA mismatch endonuclease (patch repair protein)